MTSKKSKNKIVKNKVAKQDKKKNVKVANVAKKAVKKTKKMPKENLIQALDILDRVEDNDLRELTRFAGGKEDYLKYFPQDANEEKELLLAKMIRQAEERLENNLVKIEKLTFELEKMNIEKEVHEKLLKKNPKMKEAWKYNFMEDYYSTEMRQLSETEETIAYDVAWIEEAEEMITIEKYKNLPEDFFDYYFFDGDESSSWEDGGNFLNDDEMECGDDCSICNEADEINF
ncbi:MAG TPA: hypothetical protein DEA46_04570 [Candidatus Moranbacteria bacterium]|nr:hypothetical protein [Candidatus Moranbacteria bacterium]